MRSFKYEMGQEAKDLVTGFKGIIIYRCQHITGCDYYGLQPKADKEGKIPESQQFDENRVEIVGKGIKIDSGIPEEKKKAKDIPGGPQPNAAKSNKSL